MTNPISKAIVKAAVAMGYGKKSDYKGSSVADVLEKFAAIAKDKGGSGGGVFDINATFNEGSQTNGTIDKTDEEIFAAASSGKMVHFCINEAGSLHVYNLTQYSRMRITDNQYMYFFACVGFDSGYVKSIAFSEGSFEYESRKLN